MFIRSQTLITYVLPAASIVIIALLSALARTYNNPLFSILIFVYVGAFFGYFIGRAIWNFRKRLKEVHDYLKSVKTGALERLDSTDIAKLLERDTEYMKELTTIQKKQFRGLLLLLGLLFGFLILYTAFLGHYIHAAVSSIQNVFLRHFAESLLYLAIFFAAYILLIRFFRISPRAITDIPYTPMRSLVIYKDAIILDDIYLLKAPILAKKVTIDDRRKFIEIELEDKYGEKVQLRKVRLYVKSPRELWEQVLSKIVKIV